MLWEDEGYILSKNIFSENSIILNVFTRNHGKCLGIVYGGSSSKHRNYLQIGNKIFLTYKQKKENVIGYFSTELKEAISPYFFNNKKQTSCILSTTSILKIVLPEQQINNKIYLSLDELFKNLKKNHWIILYIFWEQLLIKELGYDISLNEKKISIAKDSRFANIRINGKHFEIPVFLKTRIINNIKLDEIRLALKFNKLLLIDNFIEPNKMKLPLIRKILESYF